MAVRGGEICGIAALKAESIPSHRHLRPWATAGLVKPAMRGLGIGSMLLAQLEEQARFQGFGDIHCATATAESLLQRRGWLLVERVTHEDQDLGVYRKGL